MVIAPVTWGMSSHELPLKVVPVSITQPDLWILALVFFGVGDLVTTAIGLQVTGVVELSPVLAQFSGRTVYVMMLCLKVAAFAGCYLLWRAVPGPHAISAPLVLAVIGILVTTWNSVVLASALL